MIALIGSAGKGHEVNVTFICLFAWNKSNQNRNRERSHFLFAVFTAVYHKTYGRFLSTIDAN